MHQQILHCVALTDIVQAQIYITLMCVLTGLAKPCRKWSVGWWQSHHQNVLSSMKSYSEWKHYNTVQRIEFDISIVIILLWMRMSTVLCEVLGHVLSEGHAEMYLSSVSVLFENSWQHTGEPVWQFWVFETCWIVCEVQLTSFCEVLQEQWHVCRITTGAQKSAGLCMTPMSSRISWDFQVLKFCVTPVTII